jgi:hypothetical protein
LIQGTKSVGCQASIWCCPSALAILELQVNAVANDEEEDEEGSEANRALKTMLIAMFIEGKSMNFIFTLI